MADAGLETSPELVAWLAADPGNAEAWAQVEATWAYFGDNATSPELMAVRRVALKRASRRHASRFQGHLRQMSFRPIAASIAALALFGGVGGWWMNKPDVYATGLGERRTVILNDGSRIVLDADTVLKVRLRRHARKLALLRGQARFDVAPDVTRPFSVQALGRTVVAVGTSFNVDLLGADVMVTLIQGKVTVLDTPRGSSFTLSHEPPSALHLVAGQRLTVLAKNSPMRIANAPAAEIERVDTDKTAAWESGQLVFEDEPLTSVVEQVSRYSANKVRTEGPAGQLRISGVFNTGDVATFIDTVERALPVSVEPGQISTIRLRARTP